MHPDPDVGRREDPHRDLRRRCKLHREHLSWRKPHGERVGHDDDDHDPHPRPLRRGSGGELHVYGGRERAGEWDTDRQRHGERRDPELQRECGGGELQHRVQRGRRAVGDSLLPGGWELRHQHVTGGEPDGGRGEHLDDDHGSHAKFFGGGSGDRGDLHGVLERRHSDRERDGERRRRDLRRLGGSGDVHTDADLGGDQDARGDLRRGCELRRQHFARRGPHGECGRDHDGDNGEHAQPLCGWPVLHGELQRHRECARDRHANRQRHCERRHGDVHWHRDGRRVHADVDLGGDQDARGDLRRRRELRRQRFSRREPHGECGGYHDHDHRSHA